MSIHLPYQIDESANRFHYYETYWKHVALDLLSTHVDIAGLRLLDYGCGRGELLKMASQRGAEVHGADLDPECVRLASAHGSTCLLEVERPVEQFGKKSFDVITCLHVLEHVPSPLQVLKDLRTISSGYLVIAVPNLRTLTRLTHRTIDVTQVNEGHLQSWDHWHFLNLCTGHAGLEFVDWGFDATLLAGLSPLVNRCFGNKASVKLETGLFRRMFPFHGHSIIALFRIPEPQD